jgi:hypothetical protein
MQTSGHFRHQADTCLRLSASSTDQNLANHFQALAQDFMAKAAAAEVRDKRDHFRPSSRAQTRRASRPELGFAAVHSYAAS